MFFKLVLLFISLNNVLSSHFRGGTIFWKINSYNSSLAVVDVTAKFGWRKSYGAGFDCTQADIVAGTTFIGEVSGFTVANGQLSETYKGTYCNSFSVANDWSYGEKTYQALYANPAMNVDNNIVFGGTAWITLINGGNNRWNLISNVKFTNNKKTNKLNNSPITSMAPIVKVPTTCPYKIRIPVLDVDGDNVRCRWSVGAECGDACDQPPNTVLDGVKCELSFNLSNTVGYYAVKLHIEDFENSASNAPYSSIPLEFLVQAYTPPSCNFTKPKFLAPTKADKSCINVPLGSTYNDVIVADSLNPNDLIAEIQGVTPPGLVQSPIAPYSNNPTAVYVNVSWTPVQSGPYIYCFTALTVGSVSSDQRCFSLAVGSTTCNGIAPTTPKATTKATTKLTTKKLTTVGKPNFNNADYYIFVVNDGFHTYAYRDCNKRALTRILKKILDKTH